MTLPLYFTLGFTFLVLIDQTIGIITPIPGWQGVIINTLIAFVVMLLWPVWLALAIIVSIGN